VTASLHLAVSRSNRGGVAGREVGDTGCWDLPSDSGVGPMVVVPVQEVRTGGLALRSVSSRIGQGQVIVRPLHAGQRCAVGTVSGSLIQEALARAGSTGRRVNRCGLAARKASIVCARLS